MSVVPVGSRLRGLARASHPGPVVAVTGLTGLLAAAWGHGWASGTTVTAAVFTGQLTIGWSNDLIDADRDRRSARVDKPVARGQLGVDTVRAAIATAALACIALSLASGWASAAAHLGLVVAGGWAYNLGLKRTVWSAVPYAVAFGSLPAVVTLVGPHGGLPPGWMLLAGALLGVGAHLLNALPDLMADELTEVRGLPQRWGAGTITWVAPMVLTAASAVTVLGPAGSPAGWSWMLFGLCLVLAGVAATARGRVPFAAAIAIAAVDVVSLLLHA